MIVLNPVIRWVVGRVEYEADPRQGETMPESHNLDGEGSKAVATPGQMEDVEKLKEDRMLSQVGHAVFRAVAARAN